MGLRSCSGVDVAVTWQVGDIHFWTSEARAERELFLPEELDPVSQLPFLYEMDGGGGGTNVWLKGARLSVGRRRSASRFACKRTLNRLVRVRQCSTYVG